MKNVVLVTGGGGYIGTELVEKIVKTGFSVRVFDTFYFGNFIKKLKDVELVKGDVRELPDKLFTNVHTIIHLAGLSNDPTADFNPQANFAINTKATSNIAAKAKKAGVKKFIFASSCSIYDGGQDDDIKNEESYVNPTKAYSLSKYQAEKELLKLADENFMVTILRMGTVFGFSHRMRYDLVINSMVRDALSSGEIKIFSDGLQWRPLVSISDVTNAYLLTFRNSSKKINKQVINISLDNFLVKDVAFIIQKTLRENFDIDVKISSEKKVVGNRTYRVTNLKAKQLLGFRAHTSIEKSVINLVKKIKKGINSDFENKKYYNIEWLRPILKNL